MRTRRFLTTSAAVLLMLAIIGSGFSYWVFANNSTNSDTVYMQKDVTQLVAVGNIAVADTFKVVFDQTADGRRDYGSDVDLGSHDSHNGITLDFSTGTNKKATYTTPAAGKDQIDGKIQRKFTTEISVSNSLAAYIQIHTTQSEWTEIAADTTTQSGVTVFKFYSISATEFDWSNVTISYKDNKEPANVGAYNAFKGIVESDTTNIIVKYNVTLEAIG